MTTPSKLFTVELANRTLPLVSRIVEDVVTQHARWWELVRASDIMAATVSLHRPDSRATAAEREIQELAAEIAGYERELEELGIVLKDRTRGLVDFPCVIDGRPAYLCWRLGESAVEHWHEQHAGYAGRRRITPSLVG